MKRFNPIMLAGLGALINGDGEPKDDAVPCSCGCKDIGFTTSYSDDTTRRTCDKCGMDGPRASGKDAAAKVEATRLWNRTAESLTKGNG